MASDTNLTAIRAAVREDHWREDRLQNSLTISFCQPPERHPAITDPRDLSLLKNSFHLDFGQVGLIALTCS